MRAGNRLLEHHWRPAIIAALVVLAVAGGYAIRSSERATIDAIRDSQLKACHRGNVIRAEISRDQVILAGFLDQAARARERSATVGPPTLRVGNADTASEYRELRARLRPIQQIDCDRVVRG